MTLHALSCSNDPCLCERVYRVRSTVTRGRARAYNGGDAISERDQHFARRTEYNPTGPAVPADPRSGPGLLIRGSGE